MGKSQGIDPKWSARIFEAMAGIDYGSVQIVIHDGQIVQIERTERTRLIKRDESKT